MEWPRPGRTASSGVEAVRGTSATRLLADSFGCGRWAALIVRPAGPTPRSSRPRGRGPGGARRRRRPSIPRSGSRRRDVGGGGRSPLRGGTPRPGRPRDEEPAVRRERRRAGAELLERPVLRSAGAEIPRPHHAPLLREQGDAQAVAGRVEPGPRGRDRAGLDASVRRRTVGDAEQPDRRLLPVDRRQEPASGVERDVAEPVRAPGEDVRQPARAPVETGDRRVASSDEVAPPATVRPARTRSRRSRPRAATPGSRTGRWPPPAAERAPSDRSRSQLLESSVDGSTEGLPDRSQGESPRIREHPARGRSSGSGREHALLGLALGDGHRSPVLPAGRAISSSGGSSRGLLQTRQTAPSERSHPSPGDDVR